jgi:TonB family protein
LERRRRGLRYTQYHDDVQGVPALQAAEKGDIAFSRPLSSPCRGNLSSGISVKQIKCIRSLLLASVVFRLLPDSASAMRPSAVRSPGDAYLQESAAGAPSGKLNVPPRAMAGNCITMVSPAYPPTAGGSPTAALVIVHVVIWKSGNVTPLRAISGPSRLQDEAMNTVRLWRYKPYARDGEPLDVTTDIQVEFDPAKPGGLVTHPNH